MLQQQEQQQQKEYQKENKENNEDTLVYSVPIATSTNIWFNGNEKKPAMYIPKDIVSRHKIDRPCKVAVYDLQQGIFRGIDGCLLREMVKVK
ncbi:MAG: hypothetical protein WCF03_20515 [Nitrososphaeraceae archaeon]